MPAFAGAEEPENFGAVNDKKGIVRFYRGARPTIENLQWLMGQKHVDTVIDLEQEGDWKERAEWAKDPSHPLEIVFFEISRANLSCKKKLQEALQLLEDKIKVGRVVYVHCRRGSDRTGMVAALYQIKNGIPRNKAEEDRNEHGFKGIRMATCYKSYLSLAKELDGRH